jgi:hypothetical protein
MDINVRIEAPALADALNTLAAAIAGKVNTVPATTTPVTPITASVTPSMAVTPPQTAVPVAPVAPPVTAAPITPPAATVPTAPQTYSMEQLGVAATQLMETPGHSQQELISLLAQFGVQALTQLPKEQYGAFATALRQMGARI